MHGDFGSKVTMFKMLENIKMPPSIDSDQKCADFLLNTDENRLFNSIHLFLELNSIFWVDYFFFISGYFPTSSPLPTYYTPSTPFT